MTKRTDILSNLNGVKPFGIYESEAAALCGMSVGAFTSRCVLSPALVGKRRLYVYDDVKDWFKQWHTDSQGLVANLRKADWVETAYGQDACK